MPRESHHRLRSGGVVGPEGADGSNAVESIPLHLAHRLGDRDEDVLLAGI
jgi:hypothetical protein